MNRDDCTCCGLPFAPQALPDSFDHDDYCWRLRAPGSSFEGADVRECLARTKVRMDALAERSISKQKEIDRLESQRAATHHDLELAISFAKGVKSLETAIVTIDARGLVLDQGAWRFSLFVSCPQSLGTRARVESWSSDLNEVWRRMGQKFCGKCGRPLRPCPKGPGVDEPGYAGYHQCECEVARSF